MKFAVRFHRDEEDPKWWLAEVPVFNAVTQGRNLPEVHFMARDLILGYLEFYAEHGEHVPLDPSILPREEGWEWMEVSLGEKRDERLQQQAFYLENLLGTLREIEKLAREIPCTCREVGEVNRYVCNRCEILDEITMHDGVETQ